MREWGVIRIFSCSPSLLGKGLGDRFPRCGKLYAALYKNKYDNQQNMQEFQLRVVPIDNNNFALELYQCAYRKAGEKKASFCETNWTFKR